MKKYLLSLVLMPFLLFAEADYTSQLNDILTRLLTIETHDEATAIVAAWLSQQLEDGFRSQTDDSFYAWIYNQITSEFAKTDNSNFFGWLYDLIERDYGTSISPLFNQVLSTGAQSLQNVGVLSGQNYLEQMRWLAIGNRTLLTSINNAIVTSVDASNTNTIFGVIANNQETVKSYLEEITQVIYIIEGYLYEISGELQAIENKIISSSELQAMLDNLDFGFEYPTNLFIGSLTSPLNLTSYFSMLKTSNSLTPVSMTSALSAYQGSILSTFRQWLLRIATPIHSLNNYHYAEFNEDTLYHDILTNSFISYSNFVTNYLDRLETSLNRKSFFSSYNSQNYDNYRDYITNYYLEVASGSQSASYLHTNWFDRIEMLLSALVFSGNGIATNTIDETEAENKSGELKDHLSSLTEKPQEQLNNLTTAGDGLLDVLGTIQNSFSSASLPNEVVLISFSNSQIRSNGASDDSIKFSPDSAFYQLLRSLTTLCWVVMGLLVFYHFFIWSAKKIYSLGRLVYEAICFIIGHAS